MANIAGHSQPNKTYTAQPKPYSNKAQAKDAVKPQDIKFEVRGEQKGDPLKNDSHLRGRLNVSHADPVPVQQVQGQAQLAQVPARQAPVPQQSRWSRALSFVKNTVNSVVQFFEKSKNDLSKISDAAYSKPVIKITSGVILGGVFGGGTFLVSVGSAGTGLALGIAAILATPAGALGALAGGDSETKWGNFCGSLASAVMVPVGGILYSALHPLFEIGKDLLDPNKTKLDVLKTISKAPFKMLGHLATVAQKSIAAGFRLLDSVLIRPFKIPEYW